MNMPLHSGSPELRPLFEALGVVPDKTTEITITIRPDELVCVQTRTTMSPEQGTAVTSLLHSYCLTELKKP